MKTLLPTSTAGSLPKPEWLAEPETLWSPWKLEGDRLIAGKQDALRVALQEQLLAGTDIVSDGEQTRQHFVTTFIEHLNGVDFENRKTVKIRDRYDASVPVVVGPVIMLIGLALAPVAVHMAMGKVGDGSAHLVPYEQAIWVSGLSLLVTLIFAVWGKGVFIGCAAVILTVGFFLKKSVKTKQPIKSV